MTRSLSAVVIVCVSALAYSTADARPLHHAGYQRHASHHRHVSHHRLHHRQTVRYHHRARTSRARVRHANPGHASVSHVRHRVAGDARPAAWCGWWMRRHLGVADRSFNLARRWASYGTSAHGPAIGTIVVWRHHVGIITGGSAGRWIVKSGNDSRAVRERQRSLAGAIAFRWPNGLAMR